MSAESLKSLADQIQATNFAIFELDASTSSYSIDTFLEFGRQLGLHRLDTSSSADGSGVVSLCAVNQSDRRSDYVPYTSRPLKWHTDGYYNTLVSRVDAFMLFCVRPAKKWGGNFLLDHEMLYMRVRDTNPDLLMALMDPGTMIVPASIVNNRIVRAQESVPVFWINGESGALSMRYSARPRKIVWKPAKSVERARKLVQELLHDSEDIVELTLQSGQGIVCNNILHGRRAFIDGSATESSRLFYRARYHDAVKIPGYM